MKLLTIRDQDGKLVGVVHTHLAAESSAFGDEGGPRALLRPQPGQTFREIEVPDNYAELTSGEVHQRVIEHLETDQF